jgi:AIPR protein.
MTELLKYHKTVLQEIRSIQLSEDDGGSLEQIFTRTTLDILTDAGETENAREAYDEGQLGTKNQHKINAYAEPDNYETIDLFITIFKGTEGPLRIPKDEVDTAVKRISNFFRKAKYKEYVNDIEESSSIFDFAHTLANSELLDANLVRINAFILTDGLYPGDNPSSQTISGIPVFYRVIDINYLYNLSEKSHIPIEINFVNEGFHVPCVIAPSENTQYQSYLAIIPGTALAAIYERFGSRLLEQNVRSFLQFTGKINKGIRNTILNEAHMFLAFNNGIAATAEEIEVSKTGDGTGLLIAKVKDFQIVNGGQTTASIYHTHKKSRKDITDIFVQLKLTVVKNRENFSEIVSRISEYANTQNKVSVSDLSSNRPFHVELEKLSRSIYTPIVSGQSSQQTRWFYERARGQYKNARAKEGFGKARQKAFDLRNPKHQVFTKEDLAKYVNAYKEEYDGRKLVIGPHWVVKGNQKNYAQFIVFNQGTKVDNIYFEDAIAKAIIFKTAEKLYGIKPHSIGDMRYITVPYSIAYFGFKTGYKLDLYKIWKNQSISDSLKELLYELMKHVEAFIKQNAPGALYGEWAKKEDCWNALKGQEFDIDFARLKSEFEDTVSSGARKRISSDDSTSNQAEEELEKLKSVPPEIWYRIEKWGSVTGSLSQQKRTVAFNMAGRVRNKTKISDYERQTAIEILDHVIEKAPELLDDIDELYDRFRASDGVKADVSIETIQKLVQWDKKNKRLLDKEFVFMLELSKGNKPLTERNKAIALLNIKKARRYGFEDEILDHPA